MPVTAVKYDHGLNTTDLVAAIAASILLGYQPYGNSFLDREGRLTQRMDLGTGFATEPSVSTPLTGTTVALTPDTSDYCAIIKPAGTIAALTVTSTDGKLAGDRLTISSSQIITALTLGTNFGTGGLALPTAAAVGDYFVFRWSTSAGKWLRIK